MSHNIDTRFVNGERIWQGIGTVTDHCLDGIEAPVAAGLTWVVGEHPLGLLPEGDLPGQELPGWRALVRSDTKRVLGIARDSYALIQPAVLFEVGEQLAKAMGAPKALYASAGSLRDGQKVWALVDRRASELLGDVMEDYFMISNDYRGEESFRVTHTRVRVECENTQTLAFAEGRSWSIRHVGDTKARLDEIVEAVRGAQVWDEALTEWAEQAVSRHVKPDEFAEILEIVLGPDDPLDLETARTHRARMGVKNACTDLILTKPDLAKWRGTAWGMMQGFLDYAQHTEPLRRMEGWRERRFERTIDGDAFTRKAQTAIEEVCQIGAASA